MTEKTFRKHVEKLNGKMMTKNEIGAVIKGLNAERFSKHGASHPLAMEKELSRHIESISEQGNTHYLSESDSYATEILFNKPLKITEEQTTLGIAYLKSFCFGKRGPRKQTVFNENDLKVIEGFKQFLFVGVLQIENSYGYKQYLPIYRTKGKKAFFDYAPIHWGKPIVTKSA